MNAKRILLLGTAIFTSAVAGFMALRPAPETPTPVVAAPVPRIDVLIAARDIEPGSLSVDALEWKSWPENEIGEGFIRRDAQPEAISELTNKAVQSRIFKGDFVRKQHFLQANDRALSTRIAVGKRAVAIKIAAETSAGGFILPNDLADVIMVRRRGTDAAVSTSGTSGSTATVVPSVISETILHGVRVLAVDQIMREGNSGKNVIVGQTATLELTSHQAEVVVAAQQIADRLSLALRPFGDNGDEVEPEQPSLVLSPGTKRVVRLISGGSLSEVGVGQ